MCYHVLIFEKWCHVSDTPRILTEAKHKFFVRWGRQSVKTLQIWMSLYLQCFQTTSQQRLTLPQSSQFSLLHPEFIICLEDIDTDHYIIWKSNCNLKESAFRSQPFRWLRFTGIVHRKIQIMSSFIRPQNSSNDLFYTLTVNEVRAMWSNMIVGKWRQTSFLICILPALSLYTVWTCSN